MWGKIPDQLCARPKTWLLLVILGVVLAAAGMKALYFRGDFSVFFEPDNPQLLAYERVQDTFSKNDNASIIIAPPGDVFNPATLNLIRELTRRAWQTPYSSRVDSLTNFQFSHSENDTLSVSDLVGTDAELTPELTARVRRVAASEPALINRLVSKSGNVAVVDVTVQLPERNKTAAVKEIAEYVKQLSADIAERYPDHNFYHTGVVFMNHAFASEAQHDAETLVPLMLLITVSLLGFMLRSLTATFASIVVVICSVAATMGTAGWLGMFMSTATVNVPTVVMTLAVADCIHLISSVLYRMGAGAHRREAVKHAIKSNFAPIFVTSATTATGFLTLNFSEVPVLADFGNLSALGVMIAFALSVTLLPAMLLLLPLKPLSDSGRGGAVVHAFGQFALSKRRSIIVLMILGGAAATVVGLQNQLNDVPTDYFSPSTEFKKSIQFRERHLGGMSPIDFSIYASGKSGMNDPEMLDVVSEFSDWLRAQPEVDHVFTLTDTYKRLNKNMHGDSQSFYRLPESAELAAQYLLLYQMMLPFGLDVNNQLNQDKTATRVMVMLQNLGSREFIAFEKKAYEWMESRTDTYGVEAASPALMFAHISEKNMEGMIKGTLIALLLISVLLGMFWGSWRLGIISLIPNLLPIAFGFGLWGLYSGQINIALSVSMSMALGIIVDDTVHFLTRYQTLRKKGVSCEGSISQTFSSVGNALLCTTAVLVAGFGVLSFSSFSLNSDMGLLTVMIISSALLVDFLFLPALLLIFDNGSVSESKKEREGFVGHVINE